MPYKIRLIASISCWLFAGSLAWAATPDIPFATIDARKILSDSRVAKDALTKFQADFQPKEKVLQDLASTLKERSAELQKTGSSLTPAQVLAKQREIDTLNRDLQLKQQQFAEDRDARKREDIQHVFSLATQSVKKVAQGTRIQMVFQDLVYANPKTDITAQVIEAMDAQAAK
jgi:outer membrane protein